MKIKSFPVASALVFTGLFLMACASRAETNRYAGATWAFADAPKVLAAAADITLAKYPDCDEATVEKKMTRVYRADGMGEAQDETFEKVLTEKGKRNNRTLALSYMLPYSTVDVVELEIIHPDGKATPVDVAANSKDAIDASQMQMNISDPNSRVLQVNIPQVEIGDVVHSVTRQTTERPFIPGQFADLNVFEGSGYIRHISYEVHAPKDRPLVRIGLRDEISGTVKYSKEPDADGGTLHHWEVNDVPRMFDEAAMPPYDMVLQRLYVSTSPDWQSVSKWYWELSKPHLDATTPEMQKTVDSLTAGAADETSKIKAVFYNVSKKVRYMGLTPEKDRPGFEPHDVELTFNKKYGVCRDKAALLVSMLREAGLHAYPVLICVGTKRDSEVPDPFFNHAIVGVETKPGKYTLMDPTDENTRELLPTYDCDQSYLVCKPEGENIEVSPVQPPEDHLMRIKTTGVLTPAGMLEAKSELTFAGVNDDEYRNAFAHMKPDDRRRFFERNLKRAMPGAHLNSFELTPEDMLDMSSELRANLDFSVDGMTASGSGKSVVSLPWIGKGFGIVNFILGGTGLDKRKYPMQTEVACGLEEAISLKLSDGFGAAVSLPSCPSIEDNCVSYQQTCEAQDGSLNCARELKLKVVEFNPDEYLTLKKTLKSLEYDQRKSPVMTVPETETAKADPRESEKAAPPVESNAEILDSHKELAVTDAHTSVYKIKYSKRILSYAGKIREAEVKVNYNPACQDAALIRGVVVSKTGERQEISTNEINVMDAAWNSSAKRYTGEKILVANLPGVDIGSTIEVEFNITNKGVPFVSGFESFQLPDELDQKSFELTAPAGLKIYEMVSGEPGVIQEQVQTDGGQQAFVWKTGRVQALPAEQQLPPAWSYNDGVAYFAGEMKSYLTDLSDALLKRSAQDDRAGEKARELAGAAKSRVEAVKAIRDFVAKSIRDAGPSFTSLPLSELSAADTTLADGYGHMADRAILLRAMLTAAGFQPEFVLASGLPPIAGITNVALSFPLPNSFEQPLVRVAVDGQTYYLNDTDQYAQLGSTTSDGELCMVLPSQQCDVIHAAPGCADKMETVYTLSPDDTGKTRVGVTRHYFGDNYNSMNHYYSELPPEERRRHYQELVSGIAQGARPVGDLTTQFDTYPGLEQFTVEVDNYSVVDGKYFYFDLPFSPSLISVGADHRTLPLFIPHHSDNSMRTEIDWPAGFRRVVIAPKTVTLDEPDGSGEARITSSDAAGKWVITHDLETSPAIVNPKDYSAMLDVESALGRKGSKVFLLEKD
jgi:transglutaminase-like putative cysteine protease